MVVRLSSVRFRKLGSVSLTRLSAAATATVVMLGWAFLFAHLAAMYDASLATASSTVAAVSRTLAAHAERVFLAADLALQSVDDRPDLPEVNLTRDPAELHRLMRRLRDSSDALEGIGIIDTGGRVVANADSPRGSDIDLSDRDYFRIHRAGSEPGMLISDPLRGRPSKRWAIPVSRRLNDSTGGFAGVIAARLTFAQFDLVYRSAGVSVAMLARNDGLILFRHPGGEAVLEAGGRILPGTLDLARSGPHGTGEDSSGVDGRPRIISHTRVRDYPLTTFAAIDRDVALADWRRSRDRIVALALAATGVIIGFAALFHRRVVLQEAMYRALEEARLASERALEEATRQRALAAAAQIAAEAAQTSAEAANRAKSTFLAHMSHELRSPLNAILGFSQVMADEHFGPLGSERYTGYARDIRAGGEHLLAIIDNILDLAKVDAGKWEVALRSLALCELAPELERLLNLRAAQHRLTLAMDLPSALPPLVTDGRLLLQILLNLATNGIKFTPPGGSVSVRAHQEEESIVICVADTGCGMTAEDIELVLQPFGRASSELARRHHDTGLGLLLANRFTWLLGGTLEIASTPGEGTCVTVRLPLAGPAIVAARPYPEAEA